MQNLRTNAALVSPSATRPSNIADLATQIVITFLEKSGDQVATLDDLKTLVESTFSTLHEFEMKRYEKTGELMSDMMRDPAFAATLAPIAGAALASASTAPAASTPPAQPATADHSEEADDEGLEFDDDGRHANVPASESGKFELPNLQRIRDERRPRDISSVAILGAGPNGEPAEFDTEEWLASFNTPSDVMIAEARADNPNNKRGWIGVYDDRIVCLFTGRPLKILGAHLKRLFEDDPNFSTFATHAGYVEGLKLPVDYPKAAPYLSTIRTDVAARRGKGEVGRPADIQAKIDKVLAKTPFDLSFRDKPDTRPGNFPEFIVCLECGEAMHDIRPHLRDKHKTYYDRYKRDWHISGRAPAVGEEGMSFMATRRHAAEMLEAKGIPASEQVKPDKWPGVLKDKVLCMIDGQLVDDLERHLASTGQAPIAHYRARFELPANYPTTPPSTTPSTRGSAPAKKAGAASSKTGTRAKSAGRASTARAVVDAANDQPVPVAAVEAAPEESVVKDDLAALTEKLQRDMESFKQRKAPSPVAAPAPAAATVLPMPGRTTVEKRLIESKGVSLPVTVERRPGKLHLKH